MCTICQALNPSITTLDFHGLETPGDALAATSGSSSGSLSASLPTYTTDQIASYLTDGYWQDTGRSARAFDVTTGDTLMVDLSGLGSGGQAAVRNALNAWSAASGLNFEETSSNTTAANYPLVHESGDAGANTGGAQKISVNQTFRGKVGSAGDKDWIAVEVEAGKTYSVSLKGTGGTGSLSDTVVQLFDSSGGFVNQNDDRSPDDRSSALSFTAEKDGVYYVAAGGYGSKTGSYDMTVTQGRSNSAPDITFRENDSGAFSTSYTSGGTITSSVVNVSADWSRYGAYYQQTYIHEIGHALGLGHGGNYNGSASFSTAHYANDSYQMSLMSYFNQSANPNVNASKVDVQTPQLADVLAIQNLYGQPTTTRTGDTIYGDDTNTTDFGMGLRGDRAATIVDSGGTDTINFGKRSASQKLDLNTERFSNIDGKVGNLAIARGTVIENAITGSGNDKIIGNSANNILIGNGGNDSLIGNDGNDTLVGGAGSDSLSGGEGTDRAVFDGKSSDYSIHYDASAANGGAVRIQQGNGAIDTLSSIEKLDFGDTSIDMATLLGQLKAKYGAIAAGSSQSHKASLDQSVSTNQGPDARNDAATTKNSKAVVIKVVANDTDPDGDKLSVTGVDGSGLRGSVKVNSDGTVTYDPGTAFDGLSKGQSATETFTYTVDDGHGGRDTAQVSVRIDGTYVAPAPVAPSEPVAPDSTDGGHMEIGSTQISQENGSTWQRVGFSAAIENAAVVMGPISFNGVESAVTRVRNVTSTGFEFQIDEWDYLDGRHLSESVSWMAGSIGSHVMDDGSKVTFGATQANGGNIKSVALDGFSSNPTMFGQLAADNGSNSLVHRFVDSGRDGFGFKVQAEEGHGGDVGGKGTFYYAGVEAASGSTVLRGGTADIDHSASSVATGVGNRAILADMQSFNGQDTAGLRYQVDSSGRLKIHVMEEQSKDGEMIHAKESVGWFAAKEGRYALRSDQNSGNDADSSDTVIDGSRMQIGTLQVTQDNASQWHHVTFDDAIDAATVVMGPASGNGKDALTLRVRDVTSEGFSFQVDEWDYLDGVHATETISWMAGTAGDHQLTDGTRISFGSKAVSSTDGGQVTLAGFSDAPLVFGQVSGDTESRAMTHRIENADNDSFDFFFDLEEAQRGQGSSATSGNFDWAALDSSADSILFRTGTLDTDHDGTRVLSDQSLDDAFFADMLTSNGQDTVNLRYDQSGGNVHIRLYEEQSGDAELVHTNETIGWMTAQNGVYDLV
ncbi:Ig-like domain-containing protein [Limimaricola litoreus]|uniref:M10 family metallopeptidase C-terminal domain-containing protein n=1 Tax=Limimaricola litoreus TaxID=2955316 RepID=A0A9X2JN71_9RHOB|nr:M10 family metallopeptidase C-terminal domain-containing protein [Limimaricola litoreus]MCP1168372.1 M10 family metallopeptidase C-terminal domain-containing protein [Limimaricola litoreus]